MTTAWDGLALPFRCDKCFCHAGAAGTALRAGDVAVRNRAALRDTQVPEINITRSCLRWAGENGRVLYAPLTDALSPKGPEERDWSATDDRGRRPHEGLR
ncbi:protein of unknown function [Methanoculleus bourgensis]|uniref:Uncharacterized protein n=1 Tax=Methanoculleus bourgensis TaxID=83986 RepID=A0A0X8XYK0_9EURY|nr:protein of unknown function [Methanoculleus bourgensis]